MRGWLLALGIGALLALAGCGGTDDPLPVAGPEPGAPAGPPREVTPPPIPGPAPSRAGRIVFPAFHAIDALGTLVSDVFVMDAGGAALTQVTRNESASIEHREAQLSRDGRQVVFSSRAGGGPAWITVANASAGSLRVVSELGDEDTSAPTVHPGNRQVVFVSCCTGIHAVDTDGRNRRTLSHDLDEAPSVSPAGGQITFVSRRDGNSEIYVMNRDGSGQRRLTTHPARDVAPVFSADSTTIAFVSERDGRPEVYVMRWNGADLRRVTSRGGGPPSFAGNSPTVVFTASDSIFAIHLDGTGLRLLARGRSPAVSPDGRSVAFLADDAGGTAIYAVNVDGTGLERLTEPSWALSIYDSLDWK